MSPGRLALEGGPTGEGPAGASGGPPPRHYLSGPGGAPRRAPARQPGPWRRGAPAGAHASPRPSASPPRGLPPRVGGTLGALELGVAGWGWQSNTAWGESPAEMRPRAGPRTGAGAPRGARTRMAGRRHGRCGTSPPGRGGPRRVGARDGRYRSPPWPRRRPMAAAAATSEGGRRDRARGDATRGAAGAGPPAHHLMPGKA